MILSSNFIIIKYWRKIQLTRNLKKIYHSYWKTNWVFTKIISDIGLDALGLTRLGLIRLSLSVMKQIFLDFHWFLLFPFLSFYLISPFSFFLQLFLFIFLFLFTLFTSFLVFSLIFLSSFGGGRGICASTLCSPVPQSKCKLILSTWLQIISKIWIIPIGLIKNQKIGKIIFKFWETLSSLKYFQQIFKIFDFWFFFWN